MLALNQHHENWLRYRSLKEALEREKWLYITGSSSAYSGSDSFRRFVINAEAMMSEERSVWLHQASDTEVKSDASEAASEQEEAPSAPAVAVQSEPRNTSQEA